MKRLIITEEEKQRILEMHETATKKNYLSEQATQTTKDITVPQKVRATVKGKFNWDNMLKLWRTQSQGYTPGDDYMWFSKHPADGGLGYAADSSVLFLYTFNQNGNLSENYFFQHYLSGNGQVWQLGRETDIFGAGYKSTSEGVLAQVFYWNFENKYGSTKNPQTLNKELYNQFITNYVKLHPSSAVASAFTKEPRINDKDGVHQEQLTAIKQSPVYKSLANVTPTTNTPK
jgi:hypothetical protein